MVLLIVTEIPQSNLGPYTNARMCICFHFLYKLCYKQNNRFWKTDEATWSPLFGCVARILYKRAWQTQPLWGNYVSNWYMAFRLDHRAFVAAETTRNELCRHCNLKDTCVHRFDIAQSHASSAPHVSNCPVTLILYYRGL